MSTVNIRNISPLGDIELPLTRTVVKAGKTVTVTDEQAERLLCQHEVWAPADKATEKILAQLRKGGLVPPAKPAPKPETATDASASDNEE